MTDTKNDAGALADVIDYKSLPFSTIPEPEHALDIARTILASDWLAAYVAAREHRAVREALAPVRSLADVLNPSTDAAIRLRAALSDDREGESA